MSAGVEVGGSTEAEGKAAAVSNCEFDLNSSMDSLVPTGWEGRNEKDAGRYLTITNLLFNSDFTKLAVNNRKYGKIFGLKYLDWLTLLLL